MKDNKEVSEASEDGKHKLLDAGLGQGVEKQKGMPQFRDVE